MGWMPESGDAANSVAYPKTFRIFVKAMIDFSALNPLLFRQPSARLRTRVSRTRCTPIERNKETADLLSKHATPPMFASHTSVLVHGQTCHAQTANMYSELHETRKGTMVETKK